VLTNDLKTLTDIYIYICYRYLTYSSNNGEIYGISININNVIIVDKSLLININYQSNINRTSYNYNCK
jgi:hypothetical protein